MFEEKKERIIQEFVPGKQVTLAHVIPHPVEALYGKMGLIDAEGAIGIFTITPSEAAIIAADVASKAAEAALHDVMSVLCDAMGFAPAPITRS